jgi:signal transduction histidine kinase
MRASLPLWFGVGAMALLVLLGGYVAATYRQAEDLRTVVEAASEVVAGAFEIERDAQAALAGSSASRQQSTFAGHRLESALDVIDASGDPRFRAEARWMRSQHQSAARLSGILGDRPERARELLLGRLRVTLSELSDTAVMLHRIAHATRAHAIERLYAIELGVLIAAILALGALIVLYQRYVAHRAVAERMLRRANEALQAHAEEKDQFLYAASHDLKEPLRMVTTYVDLLKLDLAALPASASSKGERYFGFIQDGARRMKRLLDDLSAATLAERPAGTAEEVELAAEARAVAALFADRVAEVGGSVTVEPMPRVRADRARVAQVLQNLVGNSIKYREPTRPLAVRISAAAGPEGCEVRVADNGQGIAAEHHEEIFRLFRRLHGPEVEGTGAGLAICKRIVESWGGRMAVDSQAGRGSTFSFTIPAEPRT